jgi:hypothetical protein
MKKVFQSSFRSLPALAACLLLGTLAAATAQPLLRPLLPGKWPAGTQGLADVKVVGNYAYMTGGTDGFHVVDVSNPANPVRVGGYGTSGVATHVAVSGNYAYVSDYYAGLQVTDVSNPTNPVRVGGYDTTNGHVNGVAVSGNYAYVADEGLGVGVGAGLQVIDVSNPTNCVRVGGCAIFGGALRVAVSGNYAYVADFEAGLHVIDVSNPTNCVRVGGYATSGVAYGVAVAGNYAYVADRWAGLQVIDVSNPTSPVRVGGYDTSWHVCNMAVSGNYAYVADMGADLTGVGAGLQVIDVSNPTNCVRVGGYASGISFGVAVAADRIYVAGAKGLLVLCSLPNMQFTVRIEATPGVPFTLEAATNLLGPITWTPLLTTNVPAMPFDYVDFDVKQSEQPQKFYRVHQP